MLPLACLLSIFGILQDQEPIPIDPPAPPPPKVESKVQLTGTGKVEEIVGASNRSSLPPGRHFQLDERSTTLWRLEGNRSLEMITAARATDDIRSDPDKYNVTQFTIHYKTPDFTASAGDVGASFSSYTLSGAFRGLHFDGLTNKLKIKALVGTSKPQWRMHFQDEPGEPPDRFFQGVRGEVNNEGQTVVAGLNIVHARDDLGSIKDKTGFVGIDSWVTGADVRWMVNEVWLIKAETAVTLFDPNIDLEEDEDEGYAGKIESHWTLEGFRVSAFLEHASRDAQAAAGSVSKDRDTGRLNFSWDAMTILNVSGAYSRIRTPLGAVTAWIDEVDGRFQLHRVPGFEEWILRGGYRIRMTQTNDRGGEGNVHSADLSLSRSFMGMSGGIDLGYRYTDNFDPGGDSVTWIQGLTFGLPLEFIYPGSTIAIRYSREETRTRPSANDVTTNGGSSSINIRTPWPLTIVLTYSLQYADRRMPDADTRTHTGRFDAQYTFSARFWIAGSIEVRDNSSQAPGQYYQEQIYMLKAFVEW